MPCNELLQGMDKDEERRCGMSRLIDADAFEKFIKEKYTDGESTDDIKDQMLFDLSYQPTAFNKEKVVAELKDNCDIYSVKYYQENVNVKAVQIDEAIDIVRKGGIE